MDLNKVRSILRSVELRATDERVVVLAHLMKQEKPLELSTIAGALTKDVHQASVYRIISELVRVGIVRRVEWSLRTPRYEFIHSHHHHLVCTTCGTVEDIAVCTVGTYTTQILKRAKSFSSVNSHTLELFGTCSSCAHQLQRSSRSERMRLKRSPSARQ